MYRPPTSEWTITPCLPAAGALGAAPGLVSFPYEATLKRLNSRSQVKRECAFYDLWVNVANEMARQGPAAPPLLKDLNERTVLETIRVGAPISRAEISRRAGISKPTVSLALESLRESGLVREAKRLPDGPSYGAVYFEPVSEAALALGFDVGTHFVRGAICDLSGAIRARQDVELAQAEAAARSRRSSGCATRSRRRRDSRPSSSTSPSSASRSRRSRNRRAQTGGQRRRPRGEGIRR
jgi:DNA-binding transcriptional ArsR family regulator